MKLWKRLYNWRSENTQEHNLSCVCENSLDSSLKLLFSFLRFLCAIPTLHRCCCDGFWLRFVPARCVLALVCSHFYFCILWTHLKASAKCSHSEFIIQRTVEHSQKQSQVELSVSKGKDGEDEKKRKLRGQSINIKIFILDGNYDGMM